jgi:hypothetical protein
VTAVTKDALIETGRVESKRSICGWLEHSLSFLEKDARNHPVKPKVIRGSDLEWLRFPGFNDGSGFCEQLASLNLFLLSEVDHREDDLI